MGYIGTKPSAVPLTSADITDGIITSAKIADGTIVNADINASAAIASTKLSGVGANAGEVIQVVSTHKQDTFSLSATLTFTDITGLSVSITPSSASNKILIFVNLCMGNGANGARTAFRLVRTSTAIGGGTASGSRQSTMMSLAITNDTNTQENGGFHFLDSPSTTSSTTYKVQMIAGDGYTGYINRSGSDSDTNDAYGSRTASTITVMEVKG